MTREGQARAAGEIRRLAKVLPSQPSFQDYPSYERAQLESLRIISQQLAALATLLEHQEDSLDYVE